MIRTRFLIIVVRSLPWCVLPSVAVSAPFITTDFVKVRKGPGTAWSSVTVMPPSTVVDLDNCSSVWSVGWCKITGHGHTGFVPSSDLQPLASRHSHNKKINQATVPQFLIRAQQRYKHARAAVATAKERLQGLQRLETKQNRTTLAKGGSYIEPTHLWHEITRAKQGLAYQQEIEAQARAALFNAEGQARRAWAKRSGSPSIRGFGHPGGNGGSQRPGQASPDESL